MYNKDKLSRATNIYPIFLKEHLENNSQIAPQLYLALQSATIVDTNSLLTNIKAVLVTDPILSEQLELGNETDNSRWSMRDDGVLLHNK